MAKTSSKAARSSRQAKIQAAQKASSAGRGPNRIIIATVVAVVAIVAVVTTVVLAANSSKPSGNSVPAGAAGLGDGYVVNKDVTLVAGAPTVDVYEDFQCPVCEQFETQLGSTVESLAADGKLKLVYHVLTFLDGNLRNDSSSRAAEAAMCAGDAGKFLEYHNQVYANQPATEGAGWTDAQLESFATAAGISGASLTTWRQCTKDKKYDGYLAAVEQKSSEAGVTGTPTVFIGGKEQNLSDIGTAQTFTQAVAAATKSAP
jgi:protein-disulfide isomerase